MEIVLENTGRRYNKDWIFRKLSCVFLSGKTYVITGSNGSGKSTLLQTIMGYLLPSEGNISYKSEKGIINNEDFFSYVSLAAPYMDVYDEFNLYELLDFHALLKPLRIPKKDFIASTGLEATAKKPIKFYSSGMKQRVKLALAILSDTPVLLLDEPCSNLDEQARKWYADLLMKYSENRLVVIASNSFADEYPQADVFLNVENYKV